VPRHTKSIAYWTPRILAILEIAFISVFALDAFTDHSGFWQRLAALGMHLIPTAVLVIALVVAWKWEFVGGIVFLLLGVAYGITVRHIHWSAHLLITLPLSLIGAMFIARRHKAFGSGR
jgi:hypothetical protein